LSQVVAWSYSRLNNFETCPKQFYHLNVAKDVKQVQSDAMRYGSEVHKAIELRIAKGKDLPLHLKHLEPIVAKFANVKADVLVEQQLALNVNMAPTGWFDTDVWCRAIIDYAAVNGDHALVVDWKTGKMSDDFTQQKVAAAIFLMFFPNVNTVDMMYYWLKDKKHTVETLHREDIKHVWTRLQKRIQKYTRAHTENEFPARPSGLCKKFCPVTACPHHGE
jgi:hypothetical protein